ncbi:MAG: hypothetical protein U0996_20885 [Planctomycetaceae bacterium]
MSPRKRLTSPSVMIWEPITIPPVLCWWNSSAAVRNDEVASVLGSGLDNHIPGQRFEPFSVCLYHSDRHLACSAGIDIAHLATLSFVRAANNLTLRPVPQGTGRAGSLTGRGFAFHMDLPVSSLM